LRIAPSTSRSSTAATATATAPSAIREIQWRTPAPAFAPAAEISRATAICSADPGTIRMMKADSSAASEP
jgi:hypothetical protein